MRKVLLFLSVSIFALGPLALSQDTAEAVYKNPKAPIPDRVHDLLSRMTLEEKVAQLESGWIMPSVGGFKFPSIFDGDQLNEALVKKAAAEGLGTYAFLDEFTGTGDAMTPRIGAHRRNMFQGVRGGAKIDHVTPR